MDFPTALQAHIDAIQSRNLDAFMETIGDDPELILPTGVRISGRDLIREFHAIWFSDTDWTMKLDVLRVIETDSMGFALIDVDYSDIDASGEQYEKHYYLSLVFLHQNSRWLLAHDQNTYMVPM